MSAFKNFRYTFRYFFESLELTKHVSPIVIIPGTIFFNPSRLLETRPTAGKVPASKNFSLNYVLSF